MQEELNSLQQNNIGSLVDPVKQKQQLPCKCILKIKCNAKGHIERYKVRLVAKGCKQK